MIYLQFWDDMADAEILLSLSHVESFAELSGKLHLTTVSGAQHTVGGRLVDIIAGIQKIPQNPTQHLIIRI